MKNFDRSVCNLHTPDPRGSSSTRTSCSSRSRKKGCAWALMRVRTLAAHDRVQCDFECVHGCHAVYLYCSLAQERMQFRVAPSCAAKSIGEEVQGRVRAGSLPHRTSFHDCPGATTLKVSLEQMCLCEGLATSYCI